MMLMRKLFKGSLQAAGYLSEIIGYWVLALYVLSGFSLGRALTLLYGISERYLVMGATAQRSIWIFLLVTATPFICLVFYLHHRRNSATHLKVTEENKAWI
ncbi:MAG: hypothetical protein COA43_00675 [Robiginitomaculum sp.]|nr:MAG: hypothetical protein COA43_00675 [Robiginitomaculum sp.]